MPLSDSPAAEHSISPASAVTRGPGRADARASEQRWEEQSFCPWQLRAGRGCRGSDAAGCVSEDPSPARFSIPLRLHCLRPGARPEDPLAALTRRCHPGSITVNSLLWKMVNKDMNGFPVKKCSAFQFFKKRVRTGFVCFFCFLRFSEMLLIAGQG